jgi:hypothetical protein
MKCEKLDMNFMGKNFRDYVYNYDIPSVERHFQEGILSEYFLLDKFCFFFFYK